MALTTAEYAAELKERQATLARILGFDPRGMSKEDRVQAKVQAASLAALMRLLVINGVITDQQLNQAFNVAALETYPEEPLYIVTDPPGPTEP